MTPSGNGDAAGGLGAGAALALVYFLRMLGLFLVLPTFAVTATGLAGANEFTIGIALGAYGLTQAVFQIPFGRWSDRWPRKQVIVIGLLVFVAGSVLAASATHIGLAIVGRALQGAGAVSAAIMALAADVTTPATRSRAMALIGISIGVAFALAFVIGPPVAAAAGLAGVFCTSAALGVAAIAVILCAVPEPPPRPRDPAPPVPLARVLADPTLQRLDFGIFCLHLVLTATFAVLPVALRDHALLPTDLHWRLYLPVLLIAAAALMPSLRLAESRGHGAPAFQVAIVALAASEVGLALVHDEVWTMAGLLLVFFLAFNVLEAMLPAFVSRAAPAEARGAALGVYATAQFVGIAVGGLVGGALHHAFGIAAVLAFCGLVLTLWALVARGMRLPGDAIGGHAALRA